MNAPPPYYAPGPKKSNVGIIVAIVVGAIALCCIAPAVFFGFMGKNVIGKAFGLVGCGWQIGNLRNGLVAYAKDHGGKLPAKEHWQEDISKYLKAPPADAGPIQFPSQDGDVCDLQSETSVTFNADLAGKTLDSIKDPDTTIILWETAGKGRNQAGKFSTPDYQSGPKMVGSVPRGWIQQPIYGEAFWTDQRGFKQAVPSAEQSSSGVKISTDTKGPSSKGSGSSSGD